MRIGVILVLLATGVFAADAKPVCDKNTRGKFWPDEANQDRKVMFDLSRRGELEICASHDRKQKKFAWEPVGVNVTRIAKQENPPERQ